MTARDSANNIISDSTTPCDPSPRAGGRGSHSFLYACVRITPSTYQTWREISSPTSAELLQHVHSSARHRFQSLHDFRDDYLKSLHRLQHLTLNWVRNVDLDSVNLFAAFQNTLSSLSLFYVSPALDAFIKLLGYLPKLRKPISLNPHLTRCIGQSLPLPRRHAGRYVSSCPHRIMRVSYRKDCRLELSTMDSTSTKPAPRPFRYLRL